jgi:hypothetical protein
VIVNGNQVVPGEDVTLNPEPSVEPLADISLYFIFLTRAHFFKKMNGSKKTHRCIKTNHQHATIFLRVSVSPVPHHV